MICISKPFKDRDFRIYQTIHGLYDEQDNELDIIVVGASNVYASFQSPLVWHDYGLKSYSYSIPMMSPRVSKDYIEEAYKTQKNALFVVALNFFKTRKIQVGNIHDQVDHLPWSINKVSIIEKLTEEADINGKEKLEFYLPFYRFHALWSTLKADSYGYYKNVNGLKSASYYSTFLRSESNLNYSKYNISTDTIPLSKEDEDALFDLMEYCSKNGIRLAFTVIPQAVESKSDLALINEAARIVEKNGYKCFNLIDKIDEIGLNLEKDFYNETHMNIHGSIKFTNYIVSCLDEEFGLIQNEKKGSEKGKQSWDSAYEEYMKIIGSWTLDFEREHRLRDMELEAPSLILRRDSDYFSVRWHIKDDSLVDGYLVYRRSYNPKIEEEFTPYELVEEKGKYEHEYLDKTVEPQLNYVYTVVPYREENGVRVFGDFSYDGVGGTGVDEGPNLIDIEETDDGGVKIEWEFFPEAVMYNVYRRKTGEIDNWEKIEVIEKDNDKELPTEYVDYYHLPDAMYIYTVSASYKDNVRNTVVESGWNKTGLLIPRSVTKPNVEISATGNKTTITWDKVDDADYYLIYKKEGDSWRIIYDKWNYEEMLTKLKKDGVYNSTNQYTFTDSESKDSGVYIYRVVPVIENGYDAPLIELANVEVSITK